MSPGYYRVRVEGNGTGWVPWGFNGCLFISLVQHASPLHLRFFYTFAQRSHNVSSFLKLKELCKNGARSGCALGAHYCHYRTSFLQDQAKAEPLCSYQPCGFLRVFFFNRMRELLMFIEAIFFIAGASGFSASS